MIAPFEISAAEGVLFWVVGSLMVLFALALLFAKRTIHIAVSVVGVMVGLAILFVANEAPFLGIVQIVVYTGAVMMLFLFVIMLAGVDATESFTENIKSQRFLSITALLASLLFFITLFTRANLPDSIGLAAANADTNPVGVARIVFGDYIFSFGMVAALLITAALGALLLTHRVDIEQKADQRTTLEAKMAEYAATGDALSVGPLPNPGVFAQHNAADIPSLDPDRNPIASSISSVLRVRSMDDAALARTVAELSHQVPGEDETSQGDNQKEIEA